MNDLTTQQLRRLLAIQQQVDKLQAEKARILGGQSISPAQPKMSAAARKKISDAAKARWKAVKAKGGKKL